METNRTVVGVDTAKRVFQLHWVDMETGEIVDLKLTRAKFLRHFAERSPCVVAMEACGGSQHWAREVRKLGHEARLLPARAVRPFVAGNKNDVRDARAIWTAAQQPGVKTVAVKSEEQQAVLALHRMRQQLVKFRTAQINALRGLLSEYGEVMAKGRAGIGRGIAPALDRLAARLPAPVVETLREQWSRVGALDKEIAVIERRIALWHRSSPDSQRVAEDPRRRHTDRDCRRGDDGRSCRLQFRARVRRLARSGAAPHGHRGAGAHARHLQARRQVSADPAGARGAHGARQKQDAARMGRAPGRAATAQRGHSGAGQQDRANDLGPAGP